MVKVKKSLLLTCSKKPATDHMNYHSLLDWRLGVGLLRSMNNGKYSAGADRHFDTYFEISEWLEFATQLRDNFIESFPEKFPRNGGAEINGLPVITWGARQRNMVIIIHPFWDLRNMSVENWLTESKMEIDEYVRRSGGKLSIVDSFNLHRRPGWCYEYLVNRI